MRTRRDRSPTKGVVLVFVALALLVVVGCMALAVDVGYRHVVQTQLQTAADAAALAGASGLSVDQDTARHRALEYAQKNPANGAPVLLQAEDVRLLPEGTAQPTAIQVTARLSPERGTAVGSFLAKLVGVDSFTIVASATATFGPRDIMLTLDYSASMSYDSQTRHIDRLGREEVEESLLNIWNDLGSPRYGNMQYNPVYLGATDTATILNTLGLNGVPYPYPPRNWSQYFAYVQGQEIGANDRKTIRDDPHYRQRYGYQTLMDYWQAVQYKATQDAIPLWRARQEPVTAVKDAVGVFLAYMEEQRTDDRLGLAAFTYTDDEGHLEVPLTDDYALVESTSRQRQAGHYHNQTNIAGGMEAARNELLARGRAGALRLIVLLSDGHANWHHGDVDEPAARNAALRQADLAAQENVPILTISLGADADQDLMQQIAEITDGIHFVVPGGADVDDYREQLFGVFARIAAHRPLRLVD